MQCLLRVTLLMALLSQLGASQSHADYKSCIKYCGLAYRDCVAPSAWSRDSKSCAQLIEKLRAPCIAACRASMAHCKIDLCSDPTQEFEAKMKDRLEKERSVGPIENRALNPGNSNN